VLATKAKATELGLKPLARIICMCEHKSRCWYCFGSCTYFVTCTSSSVRSAYGDAAVEPIDFTIAPSHALPVALKKAKLQLSDISLFEFNEAFSVVARANEQILGLDPAKVNVLGGAVSLGHPIGSSGSRILVTLVHQLKPGQLGAAAICNGGGGASAIIVERLG
jgi:acetyl-CoA C-acetyltransferase